MFRFTIRDVLWLTVLVAMGEVNEQERLQAAMAKAAAKKGGAAG